MPNFTNLTANEQKEFTLDKPGVQVFFLLNESGDFSFKLGAPGAEAYIFALFTGEQDDTSMLKIDQIHTAPKTTSKTIVKFLGKDRSSLRYEGLIRVEPQAIGCTASQKHSSLLLSEEANAFSFPSLEILTDDVICHHGSTTSRASKDHLFYAQSRGLSPDEAQQLLAEGFINDFILEIERLGTFPETKAYKNKVPSFE